MADQDQEFQKHLSDLALDPAEFLESLPPAVQARAEQLERLQARRERLERNYLRERLLLEETYEKLYAPLYEARSAIVTGAEGANAADADKGIPCFWLTAFMRCDAIREGMGERDPEVLRYLKDLRVEKFGPPPKPAKPAEEVARAAEAGEGDDDDDEDDDDEEEEEEAGFRLRFVFDENPFFTNTELVKTYWIEDDGYGEPVLQKAEGTPIDWKAGKNVTVKVMKKKPRRGAPPTAKPQTKTEPVDSFFTFFSPPEIPQTAEAVGMLDEDAIEALREEVEADFEVGMVLRDELAPDAYRWYTGEAAQDDEDEDEDDEDEEDEDDEDDEDDDDESDESDDDDEGGKKGRKGGKGGGKRGGGGGAPAGAPLGPDGKPQECKQQ